MLCVAYSVDLEENAQLLDASDVVQGGEVNTSNDIIKCLWVET
jgi:hypothetical protein